MLHKLIVLFVAEAVKSCHRCGLSSTSTTTTVTITTFSKSSQTVRFAFALELPLRALSVWPENSTTSASFSLSTSLNFLPNPIRQTRHFSALRP